MLIKYSDGVTFGEDLTYCDGSENLIMTSVTCSVPINALRALPYNLDWGDSIIIKVSAINNYGSSLLSDEGNGAIILTNPDAPVNLAEDYSTKTEESIGLNWVDGTNNGGANILDYRVSFDQGLGTDTFIVLESGIPSNSYIASGLTPGEIYKFKVQSRNDYDFSTYSTEIEVLCAFVPFAPNEPSSSVINENVLIEWTAPANNGSPLIGYRVLLR